MQFLNLTNQRTVSADKDGNLVLSETKSISGETIHWKPAGRDLWVYPQGQSYLAAIRDRNGRVARLAPSFPAIQLERVPWYANSHLNEWLIAIAVLTFVCVLWTAVLRILQRKRIAAAETVVRRLRGIQIATSILWILILLTIVIFAAKVEGPATFPPSGAFDTVFLVMNIVVGIAILLSVWTAVTTVLVWRLLPLRFWLRFRMAVVALSAIFIIWFSFYWKLIGPVSHY